MGFLNGLARKNELRGATVVSLHPGDPALADWLGTGSVTDAGVTITPDNARECPEVDACIGLNEDTIATVPLDLFERGKDGARERAVGHPLHELLHDKPNEWQSSAEFRQMMEGFRETHGNAYARIVGDRRGFPAALEPVHPNEMKPFRSGAGVAYRWTPPDSTQRTLLQHEVLHLRDKPAKRGNLVEGQSRVERHRETIGTAIATGRYIGRFFRNNATPKTAVVVPGQLTDKGVEDIRKQWETRHAGVENAHRVAVTHSGMDVKNIGSTNSDAKVVETYEQAVGKIARVWGVPLHLIGEMSKQTSWGTGIEQQSIGFVVYYMRAKFVVWEQALNLALMSGTTRQRFYFEFNIDALLRGDFKTRMEGFALMVQWGLASVNEIRRLLNLPPVTGGDERLQPLNMVPASRIMDVLLKEPTGQQSREDQFDRLTRVLKDLVAIGNGKSNGHHVETQQ